jgi:hypothetical protein
MYTDGCTDRQTYMTKIISAFLSFCILNAPRIEAKKVQVGCQATKPTVDCCFCLEASARDYLVKSLFLYVTTYYRYVWTFSVSVKIEATGLYDTSLGAYWTTQRHISNTDTLYCYFREKLKFPLLRRFSTRVASCLPTFRDKFPRLWYSATFTCFILLCVKR